MAKTEIEKVKLYNGTVEIDFYPNSHQYKINGVNIPSVTGITGIIDKSQVLLGWAERLTNEYMDDKWPLNVRVWKDVDSDSIKALVKEAAHQYAIKKTEAADIGTLVHDYAMEFAKAKINGTQLPRLNDELYPQQAFNGINAFLEWVRVHNVEFSDTEFVVYSKQYKYVGTCDVFATVDGVETVLDYKTSKGVYPEAHLQVSAYHHAFKEEYGYKYSKAAILHFNKDTGEFAVHEVNTVKAFQGFKAALKLKNVIKEIG
jgi:hypothetical protein